MKKKRAFVQGEEVRGFIKRASEQIGGAGAAARRLAVPAAVTVLSFVLSATRGPMGTYPFGAAAVCAASGSVNTVCAFAGAMLGTLAMSRGALWQILILFLILGVRIIIGASEGALRRGKAFRRLFREAGYLRVTVAAAAAAGLGLVGIFTTDGLYYGIASAVCGVFVCAAFTAAFMYLSSRESAPSKRLIGVCALFGILTAALSGIGIGFDPGTVFAFSATVYFTVAGGAAYGVAVGVACGIALGETAAAPVLAIAALTLSLLSDKLRGGAVTVSALCSSAFGILFSGLSFLTDTFPEICLAAAVLTPLRHLNILPRTLPAFLDISEAGQGDGAILSRLRSSDKRYEAIGASLDSLSKMLISVCDKLKCPSREESYRICTAARARFCCGCKNEEQCSGLCEREVTAFFDRMSARLAVRGSVSAKLVPEELARRCYKMDSIIDAVNTSARRAAGMSESCKSAELFASDYGAVASLLREAGEGDGGWERDVEAEESLREELDREGFSFAGASVYGKRARHVFMRSVDMSTVRAGENDVRECIGRVLGCRMSPLEFSIDSGSVSASCHTVPKFAMKTGRYSAAGSREDTSGDSVCSFKNGEGYFYTLVSDGMGSGHDAAVISGVSSMFLEKLLSAGCPMRSALEMLNCFVRGSGGEQFTTVDLMEADLYTGMARFIKSGAAPSFVIRNGQLYRLHSKTVPVGIMRALDAEAVSFELMAGDTVIMMSDGVTGSYEDCPWLYELLCGGLCRPDSPAQTARLIGETAAEKSGKSDDITVCVMKVTETESK